MVQVWISGGLQRVFWGGVNYRCEAASLESMMKNKDLEVVFQNETFKMHHYLDHK